MTIRSLHLLVGVAAVLAFLGTGAYMATHFPAAYEGREAVRYMYRANHVYVLLGGLINLALGLYRPGLRPGWRGIVAQIGSVLVLAAPFLLLAAFFFEAPRGTPERAITLLGVFLLLVGVLAQWPNRARPSGAPGQG